MELGWPRPEPAHPQPLLLPARACAHAPACPAAAAALGEQSGSAARMSQFNKVLMADNAGPAWQRAYHTSSYALAGLLPAGLVSPEGGVLAKVRPRPARHVPLLSVWWFCLCAGARVAVRLGGAAAAAAATGGARRRCRTAVQRSGSAQRAAVLGV